MRRTFHTALSLMEALRRISASTSRPRTITRRSRRTIRRCSTAIKARVKSGQWETIGGMWVEPDTNMPTGESLTRQILYGQRYFEKHFGMRHTVCWLPDCFGFSGALPQLLQQGGIDSFFTIKVNWSETNRIPVGSVLVGGARWLAACSTHTFDNPMHGYNGFVQPDCFVPTWKNFRGKVHPRHLAARRRLWRWRWRHDARNGRARGAAARLPGHPAAPAGARSRSSSRAPTSAPAK